MGSLEATFDQLQTHPVAGGNLDNSAEFEAIIRRASPATDDERLLQAMFRWMAARDNEAFIRYMFAVELPCGLVVNAHTAERGLRMQASLIPGPNGYTVAPRRAGVVSAGDRGVDNANTRGVNHANSRGVLNAGNGRRNRSRNSNRSRNRNRNDDGRGNNRNGDGRGNNSNRRRGNRSGNRNAGDRAPGPAVLSEASRRELELRLTQLADNPTGLEPPTPASSPAGVATPKQVPGLLVLPEGVASIAGITPGHWADM